MSEKKTLILDGMGVLQTRTEGHLYCAYLSPAIGDFDNGVIIGSIAGRTVHSNKELLVKFMKLMQEQVHEIVKGATNGSAEVVQSEPMTDQDARELVRDPAKLDALRAKMLEEHESANDPTADLAAAFERYRAGSH